MAYGHPRLSQVGYNVVLTLTAAFTSSISLTNTFSGCQLSKSEIRESGHLRERAVAVADYSQSAKVSQ